MIGVIAGDIIGSRYEFTKDKRYDFAPLFHPKSKFTDDTICSKAVMRSLINDSCPAETLHSHCRAYFSTGGWGQRFIKWMARRDPQPYGSFGNGSAMRISSAGWVGQSKEQVTERALYSVPQAIPAALETKSFVYMH